jgi:toxin YoeB
VRSLEFDAAAFEDLAWWARHDRNKALHLIELIYDTQRDPFSGKGKPEPLKHELAGCWSRRIDQEHRYHLKLPRNCTRTVRVVRVEYPLPSTEA